MGEFELPIRDSFFHFRIKFGRKGIVWKLLFHSITRMVKDLENQYSEENTDEYALCRYISLSVILSWIN